jgi:hypothetical protein
MSNATSISYNWPKLERLLATSTWTDECRTEAVDYLYSACTTAQVHVMGRFSNLNERRPDERLSKRDQLLDLTRLLTPRQLLAAWVTMQESWPR